MKTKKIVLNKANKNFEGMLFFNDKTIRLESILLSTKKQGEFPFYILQSVRKELEENNILLLVNGSRKDVYPSRMTLSSNLAYIHVFGQQASKEHLVDIFDECTDLIKIAPVAEQEIFHSMWFESLGN